MKLTYNKFKETVKELEKMFNKDGYNVEVMEVKENNKALVTITTEDMILEGQKIDKYFYGAILNCDNFSIKAVDNKLVIVFGFHFYEK